MSILSQYLLFYLAADGWVAKLQVDITRSGAALRSNCRIVFSFLQDMVMMGIRIDAFVFNFLIQTYKF